MNYRVAALLQQIYFSGPSKKVEDALDGHSEFNSNKASVKKTYFEVKIIYWKKDNNVKKKYIYILTITI